MNTAFLWGAATSAHQVEGGNIHNDWWAWEKQRPVTFRSGRACEHYERYGEDFALARQLGHNAHRLSLEWSRIELRPGVYNSRALAHYRQVLLTLKRESLTSFVTLHHFTNPLWFAQAGGWADASAAALFSQYVERVVQELGDLVDYWVTINEPHVYATMSYWHKRWPPHEHSWQRVLTVIDHMAAAHIQAYHVIHRYLPRARVGMAHSVIGYFPARPTSRADRFVVAVLNWGSKQRWYALTRGAHDYLGINYYFSVTKRAAWRWPFMYNQPWSGATSDLGWPIRPEGLTHILKALQSYNLPIYITENGVADTTDSQRPDFIRSHLRAIEQAQAVGVDVRGYLHWSLLDNFEWADGFTPRFGLVAVDYQTQQRLPRPSAYAYKAIIEQSLRRH
ncbi:MAG: glycoside hydrolase family 1 protein [Candidatus Andersenbacteria bacterium]